MALWRVLDYTSTRQTNPLNSNKNVNFEARAKRVGALVKSQFINKSSTTG